MLKHTVTYTNFNDEEVTRDLYFNLTVPELVKVEVGGDGGSLQDSIQKIMAAGDKLALVREFEKIIAGAYGQKSEDGERFEKSKEATDAFMSSAAYDALFTDLIINETTVADFIIGIMPKDLANKLKAQAGKDQDKPTKVPTAFKLPSPPRPPTS